MSEGVGETRPEAEGELALARIALAEGDLRHAATHVGNAIAFDPTLVAAYETLDELSFAADDVLALFPVGGGACIGAAAARSYLLARSGAVDEAFGLLCDVAAAEPGKPWAAGWLGTGKVSSRLDPRRAAEAMTRLALALPDPADAHQAEVLAPFLDLARRLVAAAPDRPGHTVILWQLSGLARRLGAHDEAIAWCRRAERTDPGARAAIMLGYALRSAGRLGEMHEAWLRALSRDPGNVDLRVDIAEQLASQGHRAEGLPWLEEALQLDPGHPKAFPSACEMRYAHDGDVAHLVRLADWWREHPELGYAHQMLAKACHGRPWLSVVPQPREAICDLAIKVAEAKPGQLGETSLQITLSALEVPSAMAAVLAAMPYAEIAATPDTPEPDIRTPLADGRYRLWVYEGTRATPAVPAPSPAAVAALHSVASSGFWPHPIAAYDAAVSLSGLGLDDLLGLLAHVTPVPGDPPWQRLHNGNPVYWPRFAQAWTCLGLLHHQADEPWPSSTRRGVLVDLARGPEDWATDAALNALVVGAWVDPGIRDDVAAIVGFRFLDGMRAYQRREVTIIGSMAHLTLATPAMEPAVTALARDLLARDTANGDAPDESTTGQ